MSLCSGYYPDDSGDYGELWREGWVMAARKEHKCIECGRAIGKGERYAFAKQLFCGSWEIYRRCLACQTYAEVFATLTNICLLWGGIHEEAEYGDEFVEWNDEGEPVRIVPTYEEFLDEWNSAGAGEEP